MLILKTHRLNTLIKINKNLVTKRISFFLFVFLFNTCLNFMSYATIQDKYKISSLITNASYKIVMSLYLFDDSFSRK